MLQANPYENAPDAEEPVGGHAQKPGILSHACNAILAVAG
jgi:hypothetical protein